MLRDKIALWLYKLLDRVLKEPEPKQKPKPTVKCKIELSKQNQHPPRKLAAIMKCKAIVRINPILSDSRYMGLMDNDPRLKEVAERLISVMRKSDAFEDDFLKVFEQGIRGGNINRTNAALNLMYEYADKNEIWLGHPTDEPEDKVVIN